MLTISVTPFVQIILNKTNVFFKVTVLIFLFASNISAENYPKTKQPWTLVASKIASVEISYMITECDSTGNDFVFIKVFNEKPEEDSVDFDVTIFKHDNSDSTTNRLHLKLKAAEMAYPSCTSNSFKNLVIKLPSGYNPNSVRIAVKFN